MDRYNVLVSGASGIVGYGTLKSLKQLDKCYLYGTTIYELSPACCFSDEVLIAPQTSSSEYIPWLIDVIKAKKIDMIIPTIEIDVEVWNEHRKELEQTGAVILLNNTDLIRCCLDKMEFSNVLLKNNVKCRILSYESISDITDFSQSFVVKPKRGSGSRGIHYVDSYDELLQYEELINTTHFVQEYVGSVAEEYTVSCFFDKKSDLRALMALKRKLSKQGFTEIAEETDAEIFRVTIRELASIFAPVGPTNFQFRLHNGQLKLLEINPRISSSTSIRSLLGYNESKMAVEYFLENKTIEQPNVRQGKVIRYVEDFLL